MHKMGDRVEIMFIP